MIDLKILNPVLHQPFCQFCTKLCKTLLSSKFSFCVSMITFDQLCKYGGIHTHRFLRSYEARLRLLDARR